MYVCIHFRNSIKKLSLTERTQLDTETNKCISNNAVGRDKIMYNLVTKATGCNLPWTRFGNESQRTCQTEEDYKAYFNATKALQREFREILSKCRQDVWTVSHMFEERNRDHPTTEFGISFFGQDLRVTMEEEDYQYGFNDFIGDFGGYLGLFLGGSIIGIFEIIENFMEKLRLRKVMNQRLV